MQCYYLLFHINEWHRKYIWKPTVHEYLEKKVSLLELFETHMGIFHVWCDLFNILRSFIVFRYAVIHNAQREHEHETPEIVTP